MRGKCAAGGVRGVLMPSEWTGPIKKLRNLERNLEWSLCEHTFHAKPSLAKASVAQRREVATLFFSTFRSSKRSPAHDARSQQIAIALVVLVVLVLFVVLDIAVTIAAGLQWSQSRRPG